jgi:hypothetical protein
MNCVENVRKFNESGESYHITLEVRSKCDWEFTQSAVVESARMLFAPTIETFLLLCSISTTDSFPKMALSLAGNESPEFPACYSGVCGWLSLTFFGYRSGWIKNWFATRSKRYSFVCLRWKQSKMVFGCCGRIGRGDHASGDKIWMNEITGSQPLVWRDRISWVARDFLSHCSMVISSQIRSTLCDPYLVTSFVCFSFGFRVMNRGVRQTMWGIRNVFRWFVKICWLWMENGTDGKLEETEFQIDFKIDR